MTNYDVIKKLIGPINPVGETTEDNKRFANLEEMTTVVNKLLYDIYQVSKEKDRHEYSVKKAGEYAHEFLKEVNNSFQP